MKTLNQALLIFYLAVAVLSAKGQAAPSAMPPAFAGGLVWPQITNARDLIELAKSEIKELKPDDDQIRGDGGLDNHPVITYLKPFYAVVGRDFLMIVLDTHPYTGQAILVAPKSRVLKEKYAGFFTRIQDTDVPEIKLALTKLPANSPKPLAMLDECRVWWKGLVNETSDRTSGAYPLKILTPGYPPDMARAGVNGEAKVTFTVTVAGEVRDLEVKASHVEFAGPTEEAIKLWKFEPGVDRDTRLPITTRASVTAIFRATE